MPGTAISNLAAKRSRPRCQSWLTRLAFALLVLLAAPLPAWAETAPATQAAPSTVELQTLIDTLQDDKARAALVAQLQTLIAARRTAPQETAQPADLVARFTQHLNMLAEELLVGMAVVLDAPRLWAWADFQISDQDARAQWGDVILACVVVFGLAVIAEWLVRRGLARVGRHEPTARRADTKSERRGVRLMYAVLGLLVETLPIVAFGAAAFVAMAIMLPPYSTGREAIRILVWATTALRLAVAAATAVLVPRPAWPSPIRASEETRNYLLIWVRRFAFWVIFGIPLTEAAWWLGVPGAVHALMLKGVGVVLAALVVVFILQNRETVRDWIAGKAPDEAVAGWGRLRRQLGERWHIIAIVYVIAVDLVYTLHREGGSAFVVRATVLSLAAIAAARLLVRFIERLSRRGLAVAPELRARFPLLEQRANRYLPIAIRLATIGVYALAGLAALQAWDLASFAWFRTEFGQRVGGSLLSIALVLGLALLAWEILAGTIERHLAALDQDGAPNRARRRTLLPLLRTAMLCVIVVIAGLTVLSQIGINIAPLLAGAGVIGVAIGFGSQALIKDIITGLFILIEGQIAVGDIVDLGKEHAGVVEAITIRTIRLRDLAGTVHTVPFSDVTSVKNLTKEFAFVVSRVTIAYGEDIDRVVDILRGVCDELAEDPEIGPLIIDRFDYQGVDTLNEFSVVLLLRVRTLPAKQWIVGRALNRRIKIAFDEHGVAMRDPSPVMISGPGLAAFSQKGSGGEGTTEAEAEAVATAARRRSA